MIKPVVSLEDARAMKAAGWPLNTEVVDGGMLPKHCERMVKSALGVAHRCRVAAFDYLVNQNERTYSKLKRAHAKLGREIAKLPAPNWIDEEDGGQRLTNPAEAIVSGIVGPRCFTAFQYWVDIIATLESGNEVKFTISSPDDVWPTEVQE